MGFPGCRSGTLAACTFKSVATHSGLGCPAKALLQASAFRGVAMGLAMSPTRIPVCGA